MDRIDIAHHEAAHAAQAAVAIMDEFPDLYDRAYVRMTVANTHGNCVSYVDPSALPLSKQEGFQHIASLGPLILTDWQKALRNRPLMIKAGMSDRDLEVASMITHKPGDIERLVASAAHLKSLVRWNRLCVVLCDTRMKHAGDMRLDDLFPAQRVKAALARARVHFAKTSADPYRAPSYYMKGQAHAV